MMQCRPEQVAQLKCGRRIQGKQSAAKWFAFVTKFHNVAVGEKFSNSSGGMNPLRMA